MGHDRLMLFFALVFSLLLAVMMIGAGAAKLRRVPQVTETLVGLGVSDAMQANLGRLELVAALGLLLGVFQPVLGVVAAIGLVGYFVGAVTYHVRAGDPLSESGPAVAFGMVALITAVLRASADS